MASLLMQVWVSATPAADPVTGKIPAAEFHSYLDEVMAAAQRITLVLLVPLLLVLGVVMWVSRALRYRLVDRYDQARQDGLNYLPQPADLFKLDATSEMPAADGPGRWRLAFSAVPPWSEIRFAATRRVARLAIRAHGAGQRCQDERSAAVLLYSGARRPLDDLVVFGKPGGPGPVAYSSTVGSVAAVTVAALFWMPGVNAPLQMLTASWDLLAAVTLDAAALAAGVWGMCLLVVRALITGEIRRRQRVAVNTGAADPDDRAAVAALAGQIW